MDTSYLKILNPTLRFAETKSLFYKKYLYKIKLFAPGIKTHIFYKGDMRKIRIREQRLLQTGIPNLWDTTWAKNYKIDHNINTFVYKKIKFGIFTKYRVEFPFINIYFEQETDLNNFLEAIIDAKFFNSANEISYPNTAIKDLLRDDVVVVKKIDSKYKFKVVINGGLKTDDYLEQRRNLLSYLYDLGDEVYKLNLTESSNIYRSYMYYHPTHFYCTDEKILVFLKLAYPDLIGKTFKVVKV